MIAELEQRQKQHLVQELKVIRHLGMKVHVDLGH